MKTTRQIQDFDIPHLKSGAHYSFVKAVLERAEADAAVSGRAAKCVKDLRTAFGQEEDALRLSRKSLISKQIAQADQERGALYIAYKRAVFNAVRVSQFQETAAVLMQHIQDCRVSPRAQYDQETGLLDNLLADLGGKYQEQVEALGLGTYVNALREVNERLRNLIIERTEEQMEVQKVVKLSVARKEVDEQYRALVQVVNALAVIDGIGAYADFIDYANAQIIRFRREALGRHSRGNTEETENAAEAVSPDGHEEISTATFPADGEK